MTNLKHTIPIAATLCAFLLFSCSTVERDNPYDKGGINYGGSGKSGYRTVPIGTQVWMAENLNYNVSGSLCYENKESNCKKYGRLYDWATAMELPSNCNYESCTSLISEKHRGICPDGWHIPSRAEWTILIDYLGGEETAGKYLKTSDWNGNDEYGFSALPGGQGYHNDNGGSFSGIGGYGNWWSSSGHCVSMSYYYDYLYPWCNLTASASISVRCLQD
jgi:uncharacterized protein (TIGR02145 family)